MSRRDDRKLPRTASRAYPVPRAVHGNQGIPVQDREVNDGGAHRRRIQVACARCRQRKIKCSGDPGDGSRCQSCAQAGVEEGVCVYKRIHAIGLAEAEAIRNAKGLKASQLNNGRANSDPSPMMFAAYKTTSHNGNQYSYNSNLSTNNTNFSNLQDSLPSQHRYHESFIGPHHIETQMRSLSSPLHGATPFAMSSLDSTLPMTLERQLPSIANARSYMPTDHHGLAGGGEWHRQSIGSDHDYGHNSSAQRTTLRRGSSVANLHELHMPMNMGPYTPDLVQPLPTAFTSPATASEYPLPSSYGYLQPGYEMTQMPISYNRDSIGVYAHHDDIPTTRARDAKISIVGTASGLGTDDNPGQTYHHHLAHCLQHTSANDGYHNDPHKYSKVASSPSTTSKYSQIHPFSIASSQQVQSHAPKLQQAINVSASNEDTAARVTNSNSRGSISSSTSVSTNVREPTSTKKNSITPTTQQTPKGRRVSKSI